MRSTEEPRLLELAGALRHLSPRQRAVLLLHDLARMPRVEVEARLGVGPSGLDALLHRSREAARELLEAEREPISCARAAVLVRMQLEQELMHVDRAALRAHLRTCATCPSEARRIRARSAKARGGCR